MAIMTQAPEGFMRILVEYFSFFGPREAARFDELLSPWRNTYSDFQRASCMPHIAYGVYLSVRYPCPLRTAELL